MLSGQNGVLKRAGEASETQSHAQIKEAMSLLYNEYVIDEQTGQSTDTFIKYVQAKGKIDNDGIIDTKKLAGGKTALGNGTQNNDVYKLEKIKNGYAIYYYGKSEDEEIKAIWQTDGSTLSATKNIKLTASADVLYEPDNSQTYLDIFVNYDIDTVSFEAKEEFVNYRKGYNFKDEYLANGGTLTDYQEEVEEAFEYYEENSINTDYKYIKGSYLEYLVLKDNDLYNLLAKDELYEIFSIYSVKSIPFEEKEAVVWECVKLIYDDTYKNLEGAYNENNSENLTYNEWVNENFLDLCFYYYPDIGSAIVNILPIEDQVEFLEIFFNDELEKCGVSTLEEYYNYLVENESEQLEADGITTYEEFVGFYFMKNGEEYYWYKMDEYLGEKLKNALKVEIEYPNGEKKIWNYIEGYSYYGDELYINFNYGCAWELITDYGTYKINVISESLGINYYTEYEYKYQKYMKSGDGSLHGGLNFYDMEQNKYITDEDISKITVIDQGTGEEYAESDNIDYITKNGTKFVIELTNGEKIECILSHFRHVER